MSTHKGIPLTKDEVIQLVHLVEAHPVVFSKATNASNNRLKEVAWSIIRDQFNSIITSCPRSLEQLRLKWENLKKAARKRSTKIRMNNLKIGGGKPEYIPPDEALDQVAAILSSACEEYTVPIGADVEVEEVKEDLQKAVVVDVPFDIGNTSLVMVSPALSPDNSDPKKLFFSSTLNKGKLEGQTLADEVKISVRNRNRAIADYYNSKRKNEEEFFALKKRKLELEILQKKKELEKNQ